MSIPLELFIIGTTISFGPCLAFCSPVILPYVAATRRGWREGLGAVIIFLLARLGAYVLLGLLAGLLGGVFVEGLRRFEYLVFLFGGLFISLLGLLIIFGNEQGHRSCQVLKRQMVDDSLRGSLLLGLTVGVLPCLPLLGVLSYIALKAQNFWQGAFYGLSFGMGKSISLLIPLAILASSLPESWIKNTKIYDFFRLLCGLILFLIGVNLIVSSLLR